MLANIAGRAAAPVGAAYIYPSVWATKFHTRLNNRQN